MDEVQLTQEKSFQIELSSDKNNYSLEFNLNNYIEITANQINNIIHKTYSNKYSFEEIRENKYFLKYNSLDEILAEIKDRIYNNKIIIKENDNVLILNIPLPENKEIIFELKPIFKNINNSMNELTDLIMKLNTEITNVKIENINLKNEIKKFNKENIELKNEINNICVKEEKLINDNSQIINDIKDLNNEINQLKNDNSQLKNNNIQLKNENIQLKNDNTQLKNNINRLMNEDTQLKNELKELKQKLNILWERKRNLENIDCKIINGNEKYYESLKNWINPTKNNLTYYESLKNWINPTKKIKAELLYRLSDNGDNKSTFHELCDNKGPTLTLFHINDGNIIGIYTPLSWESSSKGYWKKDMDTFIFNLNKNKIYKKIKDELSIYCDNSFGPYTASFGCGYINSMKSLIYYSSDIKKYYDKGSEFLLSNNQKKEYDLIETEVYKIVIEL